MAAITLTTIEEENPSNSDAYDVDFVSGHTVGDIVTPDGGVIAAATDVIGGIVTRAGDANGKKTRILRRGFVTGLAGAGAAADAQIYVDGVNTAADTQPNPGAGSRINVLGVCISATRGYIDIYHYQDGA